MQLWTWQDKTFDLADHTQKVRSLDFSVYTTHPRLGPDMKDKHKKAYQKIFGRLGTDQLIWCFHEYEDAASSASISEFETLGRVLWEIDVPCRKITWYCPAAWTCLRAGKPGLPDRLHTIYRELDVFEPGHAKKFEEDFTAYWGHKNSDELLDLMFLNRPESGCCEAVAFHPVDTIVKNPLLLNKWWAEQRSRPTGLSRRTDPVPLPCPDCSGKRL